MSRIHILNSFLIIYKMNYLKNPIIIGISACLLVMAYLYYNRLNDIKKNKNAKEKPFNFITPLAIGIIVWFIAETLTAKNNVQNKISQLPIMNNTINNPPMNNPSVNNPSMNNSVHNTINNPVNNPINPMNNHVNNQGILGGNSETIGTDATNTYNIISKDNIKLPSMDVFIDLANF